MVQWEFVFHLSPENVSTVPANKNPVCAPPDKLVNGYLQLVYGPKEELVSVNYRCHLPFTLNGSQQRTCLPNGTWSGRVPTCVKGTFSPGGFCSPFLMFVQSKNHM